MNIINYNGKNVRVFNDGLLYKFGTKYRGLTKYIKYKIFNGITEFVYYGDSDSTGAHALIQAVLDNSPHAEIKMFLVGDNINYKYPERIMSNIEFFQISYSSNIEIFAKNYVNGNNNRELILFTPQDDVVRLRYLESSLVDDIQFKVWMINNPKNVFLYTESGSILEILMLLLPNSNFICVTYNNNLPKYERIQIRIPVEEYYEPAKNIPENVISTITKDAKVWQFVEKEAHDFDGVFIVY